MEPSIYALHAEKLCAGLIWTECCLKLVISFQGYKGTCLWLRQADKQGHVLTLGQQASAQSYSKVGGVDIVLHSVDPRVWL